MGNEIENLRKDLIDLDIEEMKINRELYNLQLEINAKLTKEKKVRLKKNYKEIAGKKIQYLEEKKRIFLDKNNSANGSNKNNDNNNKNHNIAIETSDIKNEEVKNNEDNKLNLIINSNNFNSNKNSNKKYVNNLDNNSDNNNSNNNKKEMISSSESNNYCNVKTIYTRKTKIKKEEIKNDNEQEDTKNNNNNQKENINNEDDEDKKYDNFRYLNKNNDTDKDNDLEENLNINQYKRKFFDKLSSLCPRSNVNKSMDNKNSSVVEELEVVGLSQNEILKDKLSEFFVGTSVATSNNKQNNCSSLHNNYNNIRPKSEISGFNRQLISSSKSNNTENENNGNINSINYKNNMNNGESQELTSRENNTNNKNNKILDSGITKEKYETEETINKDTGHNTDEKCKEYKEQNNENFVNEKRLLRNNRNKSYFILEGSSSLDN